MKTFAALIFFLFAFTAFGQTPPCGAGQVCCVGLSGTTCSHADGDQGCQIPVGGMCKVTANGSCRNITNNSGEAIFISAQKASTEDWPTFLAHALTSNTPVTQCTAGCFLDGNPVAHGTSITGYATATVPYGSTCSSQVRTCTDGWLSGSYPYASCSVLPPPNCPAVDGVTLLDGQSRTFYSQACVDYGATCPGQTRTCSGGVLSGSSSYSFASCSAVPGNDCNVNGTAVAHGSGRYFYNTASVPYGQNCDSATYREYRTCTNGTMSGNASFNRTTCSTAAGANCSQSGVTVNHGSSRTFYQAATGSPCVGQTRTCTNGSLSGSYTHLSCSAATCVEGAIRVNPTSGAAEVCNSGAWVARSVTTWCLPPSQVHFDDDEWMKFHQTIFKPKDSACTSDQRSGSGGTTLYTGYVKSDDSTKPCYNNLSCVTNETAPVASSSCAARTLAWSQGSNDCFFNAPATTHYGSVSLLDNTGPVYGSANATCIHGVWNIYPGYCSTTPPNCSTSGGDGYYVPTMSYCNSGGATITSCCSAGYMQTCSGYNAACP